MLDLELMKLVAEQMMSEPEVMVEGTVSQVTRTGNRRFRTLRFAMGER